MNLFKSFRSFAPEVLSHGLIKKLPRA